MAKVSVIVPVYNVETYLPQCLDSILAQTLQDIEIICVDDGSTDNSGKILDCYAVKDERVKVIHRENAGYGAAMNLGIDAARGEYIGIVESDDCIKAEMYQTLYNDAVKDDLDLIKSDVVYWLENVKYTREGHCQWLDSYYDRVLYDEDRNIFFDFFMNIWTGIYKRDFLIEHNIRFHETPGASYQDNGFWIQTLLYCQKAKWISKAFYLYRQDNPCASVKSPDKILAMSNEYEFVAKIFYDRKDYHLLPYCYYYKLYRHRGTLMRIADEHKREFCNQIKKDYLQFKCFLKGNSYLDNLFHEITINPDKVCAKVIQEKQSIINKLDLAEKIIIYGAGMRGDIVFRGLYNEGYNDKLCCFAVSQLSNDMVIAGKKVISIEDAHQLYPNALIIVAVVRGSGMYNQMVQKLTELEISNYMDGSDIEKNFYIL